MIIGLDRTYHLIILFLVSHFIFLFIPCGRLRQLHVSFLLHVKYTLSYRNDAQTRRSAIDEIAERHDNPS